MALDLSRTALQIDEMAADIQAREGIRSQRLKAAVSAAQDFLIDDYLKKIQGASAASWALPGIVGHPGEAISAPPAYPDFFVVSADGSHIDANRHLPAHCYVINTGVATLAYGVSPSAHLYSTPRLYASEQEMVVRSPDGTQEQQIEGAVLGARRSVEEIRALTKEIRNTPSNTPTLGLLDGTLSLIGLASQGYHDYVRKELIEEGFALALEEIGDLHKKRKLAVASYVSLPNHAEVIRALRLTTCEYEVDNLPRTCGYKGSVRAPCGSCVGGIRDRDLYAQLLLPGQRSMVFEATYPVIKNHYRGMSIGFFYLNAGEEIARVEIPSWVAEDPESVNIVHSIALDQCRRGHGYPVALMEAHEQAVISGSDRKIFEDLLQQVLYAHSLPTYTSEKQRSKRLRWT